MSSFGSTKKIDTLSVAMTMQQSMLNFEDKTFVNW